MKSRYDLVWDFWTFKGGTPCLNCLMPSITLHEIIPRSRYPGWKEDLFNSIPLCAECHEHIQKNTKGWEIYLQLLSIKRSNNIMQWKGMSDENLRNLRSTLQAHEDDSPGKPSSSGRGRNGQEDDASVERDGTPERPSLPLRRSILGDR